MREYRIYRTDMQISWGECRFWQTLVKLSLIKKQQKKNTTINASLTFFHFRMDYPSLYMCKSKRGIKREDGGKVRAFFLFSIFIVIFILRESKCSVCRFH